jgi:hypothetical protein
MPPRGSCFLAWNFGLVGLSETGRAQLSKSGNGLRRDQQFARTHFPNRFLSDAFIAVDLPLA